MSDDEQHHEEVHESAADGSEAADGVGESEAKRAMEEAARKKAEKMKAEMDEYDESRKEQKEKEEREIEDLRVKRQQRKKERIEEEIRTAEKWKEEEARRKAEEEERKRKKQEEENRRKAERAAKLKEMEEKRKLAKTPNFVIVKKEGEKEEKESSQKSKEQLEEEKRAILAQRIMPLTVDGLDSAALSEKAKELHAKLLNLANQKYDLEERFKRQQYDMIELAERARQMNKGKSKRGTVQIDEAFDRLADKFPGAPPKIQLCSKYERHTDHRTYGQRCKLFEEFQKEPPPARSSKENSMEPKAQPEVEEES